MLHENVYARNVEVAGTYFRDRDSAHFIASRSAYDGVELVLEPTNKYDPNAIKVVAYADGPQTHTHIGYIPAHLAERIYKDGLQHLLKAEVILATFRGKTNLIVLDLRVDPEKPL